jgi:hypothetical protein
LWVITLFFSVNHFPAFHFETFHICLFFVLLLYAIKYYFLFSLYNFALKFFLKYISLFIYCYIWFYFVMFLEHICIKTHHGCNKNYYCFDFWKLLKIHLNLKCDLQDLKFYNCKMQSNFSWMSLSISCQTSHRKSICCYMWGDLSTSLYLSLFSFSLFSF